MYLTASLLGIPSSMARQASAVPVRPRPPAQPTSTRSVSALVKASSKAFLAVAGSAGKPKSGQRSHRASQWTAGGSSPSR